LTGRAGSGYRTETWLKLRADHAAARDAVHAELDLTRDFGEARVNFYQLFWVQTQAKTRTEYLMRPDLGRRLDRDSRQKLAACCPKDVDLQIVIGDGLSATAVATQAPRLLDLLAEATAKRALNLGRPFAVRHCRVGVMNDIGDLLNSAIVVLLIGERPGLATAQSLSAYLAYRPRSGHTDADRNLISNIHPNGISLEEAAQRIVALAETMRSLQKSGVLVKEDKKALRQ
jgi:ethanolamine ammonia-lyase small subunit